MLGPGRDISGRDTHPRLRNVRLLLTAAVLSSLLVFSVTYSIYLFRHLRHLPGTPWPLLAGAGFEFLAVALLAYRGTWRYPVPERISAVLSAALPALFVFVAFMTALLILTMGV